MLGLFLLPALFAVGLVFHLSDDDDDEETSTPDPEIVDVPDDVEEFVGSDADEVITARDEGGTILARGGDDTVVGSDNIDFILGDGGDDRIFGGADDDFVSGGQGDDRVFLGDGDDTSAPFLDDNSVAEGDDFIRGGAGNDLIIDGFGSNTVFGDLGNDSISVLDGNAADGSIDPSTDFGSADVASGGQGNDEIFGDDGDTLTGGSGDDEFNIVSDLNREQDNVTITDFNTAEDVLVFRTLRGDEDENSITFTFDPDRNAVIASDGDDELALLQGLTQADIPQIRSNLIVFTG